MALIILSGENREGIVGQPLRHPLTARLTDAAGAPVPMAPITFRADQPETLEFEGGRAYAIVRTDGDGKAEVHCAPLKAGNHKYLIEVGPDHAEGTIAAMDTGVRQLDGVTAVATADGDVQLFRSRDLREPTRPRRPNIIIV